MTVSTCRRWTTLSLPFVMMAGYALCCYLQLWWLAIICVAALCFVTYGSTSHDLVHRTLKLPARWNDWLLSVIELLSLRSGTAYRLSHLHHHAHLLADDDVEGAAAHGSLLAAIISGPATQFRIWEWAWQRHPAMRTRLLLEAIGCGMLVAAAAAASVITLAPLGYVVLVIGGSWLFPLITVYLPHDATGSTPLEQTRRFRGWFYRLVAWDHLYHQEHHLYPAVPHHHWPALAQRLDHHAANLSH